MNNANEKSESLNNLIFTENYLNDLNSSISNASENEYIE